MQKIIPLYITKIGGNTIDSIVGINTNRIHNDIMASWIDNKRYTKIRYYIDPDKDATEELLTPELPTAIYRSLDKHSAPTSVTLSLVGGGTIAVLTANIIYCYLDSSTYERCSIDAIV